MSLNQNEISRKIFEDDNLKSRLIYGIFYDKNGFDIYLESYPNMNE